MVSESLKSIITNRRRYVEYLNKTSDEKEIDLESFIDNQYYILYSDADLQHVKATILLEFYKANGFGDLMIGYKCLKVLREELPPQIGLIVVSETPDDVRMIGHEYLEEYSIDVLDVREVSSYLDTSDIDHTYLITFALESEIPFDDLQRLQPRTLYIDEYNGWRVPDEVNSTFEHRLIPGFGIGRNGILTSGINIMRDPILSIPKHPEEYYFGYISEYHAETETLYKYLMSIILLNRNSMKPINIVLLIPNPNLSAILASLHHGIELDRDSDQGSAQSAPDQTSCPISHSASILDLDLNFRIKKNFNRTIIEDPDNHIKIYIETYMPHETVLSYMNNSLEPILVTGDQSMSEAISLGKLFFYEMQDWKRELYDNFKEYCRFVLPRNTSLHYFLDRATRIDTLQTGQIDTVITNIVKKTQRNDLSGYMGVISCHIKENHDLKLDMMSIIKRMIVGNSQTDRIYKKEMLQILCPPVINDMNTRKRRRSMDESTRPSKKQRTHESPMANFCIIC